MKILLLPVLFILSIVCRAQSDPLMVELFDGKVLTYSVSEIEDISISDGLTSADEQNTLQNIVSSFILYQNYPNPFNPGTIIKYKITGYGLVGINIYDIQGELVYSLQKREHGEGVYSIYWDGRNNSGSQVSSGIYLCRIDFNDAFLTKKMLLIR